MNQAFQNEPGTAKASRMRSAILAVAANLFASRGFAATRLEDVAEELQITRAALFYYFRDKQTLYDEMIADSFSSLASELGRLLDAENAGIAERLESAVGAWVDAIVARPALARLILRFVADGTEQPFERIFIDDARIPDKFLALFEQGRASGEIKPLHDDPFHAASALIGTTVFYIGALSTLMPHGQFEPLDPEQVAAHRHEMLQTARRLLGIRKSAARATRKRKK